MADFVLVGCKLPHGLVLEILDPPTKEDFMQPRPNGNQLNLAGACSLYNQRTKKAPMHFGYDITPVDKAIWEEWYHRNKTLDCVRNGMIFVADTQQRAEGIAKERRESVRIGIEPLNRAADAQGHPLDPRMQRANIPNPEFAE